MKTNPYRSLRRIQIPALTLAAIAAVVGVSSLIHADEAAPTTAPAPEIAKQEGPSVASLKKDIDKQVFDLKEIIGGPEILTDPAKRSAAAPHAYKPMQKIVDDCDALTKADAEHAGEYRDERAEFRMFLSLFGDPDATRALATEANSTDPELALEGKRSLMMVSWLASADDVDHQTTIVDKIEKLARENEKSTALTSQIWEMTRMGASDPDLTKRLQTILTDVMKNDQADQMKAGLEGEKKLASLENKPLVIAGKQPDGKDFTTADWKGKVILVDFWATWCGPCKEELPRVKKMYDTYHAQGLEVLGVSNDQSANDLTKYIKADGGMPWPQLFDEAAARAGSWNPITQGYGINGIPTMFLIDKKGVVRTVEAREKMENMIPTLLEEK
jgi:thiol-disulfide isomerase/thioredoxin